MKLAILLVVGVIAKVYGDEPEAIVGGNVAQPGQFPHQVSLRMNDQHFCGGSIISPTHVLTAAHCIDSQSKYMTVVAGAQELSRGGVAYHVKSIHVHPGFSIGYDGVFHDIALITLKKPIVLDGKRSAIPLASRDCSAAKCPAIVSGWGKTSVNSDVSPVLKWLGVTCLTTKECQKYHGSAITDKQICTFRGHGQGACQGDSGGPLIADGKLIGIVSWGIPCGVGQPDVFTSVYGYKDWILEHQNK